MSANHARKKMRLTGGAFSNQAQSSILSFQPFELAPSTRLPRSVVAQSAGTVSMND